MRRVEVPDRKWLSDPEVFAVNREEAHSDHWFYEKMEDIAYGDAMPLKQSLNGTWRFAFAKNPEVRLKEFYQEDFDDTSLDFIQVPGHIELQGYDKIQYINTLYPWDGLDELRPPEISKTDNPVSSYVKTFELKEELQGKETFLSLQGVESACYIWVNGSFVGYAEDGFTPSEFNITSFLKKGTNRLAIEVYKRSSGSWIEDQDFWRFSGIFREVYLYAVPSTHVEDLFIKTALSDSYTTGNLKADIRLSGEMDCMVKAYILGKDGVRRELGQKAAAEQITLEAKFENVDLWSAEQPNLYQLFIELYKGDQLVEVVPYSFGFREFKMIDKVMCLNGKRIVFKGVNRHEFNARRGRNITKEDMLWDIRFMKQHNINAVRTSHYPNQSEWYRLCDEYGIYLIDETNMESHGSWQKLGKLDPEWNVPGDKKEWLGAILDRAKSMVERDKNHASVLIWSCGNESYAGKDILEMSHYFHEKDPDRLVHYEGVFWNREYEETSDMESRMYAKPNEIIEYLKDSPKKPYISCEYMHAMGNSLGGMKKYIELEKYPMYQGGFIWDYIDQAIYKTLEDGREVLAYGGDFMDRPTDYNFVTNGIVYADRTPSPKAQEVKYLYQDLKLYPDETGFVIKNEQLFASTDAYEMIYQVKRDGETIYEQKASCHVLAGEERKIVLEVPTWEAPGVYTYQVSACLKENRIFAKAGYEIAFGQKVNVISKETKMVKKEMRVVHGDGHLGIHGDGFNILFSAPEGGIVSLKYDGKEYITRAPKPYYYRASTDNDRGYGYPFECGCYMQAGMFQKCTDMKVDEKDDQVVITYTYLLPLPKKVETYVEYTVTGDGTIQVHLTYPGAADLPMLPLFGYSMKLYSDMQQVRYFGKGPDENYIDRCEGARVDWFETTPEKNVSGYIVPQECGNRTSVYEIQIKDQHGQGLKIQAVDKPIEFSVLPYSVYELENAMHHYELPNPAYTYLNLIGSQMGVGGDDSWGARVHKEYEIDSSERLEYTFCISAFSLSTKSPSLDERHLSSSYFNQ
ncbi:beta-galactosidase [Lachnospiraceae bacterium KM106-2]|nr:beta-galactosidase [Lachnospiraceae bacterium KM106-2]